MAFSFENSKGTTYYLHQRETTLKNGTKQNIFFFAKEPKEGVLNAIPAGYEASESRNGLPVLRKAGGAAKEAKPAKSTKAAKEAKPAKSAKASSTKSGSKASSKGGKK